MRPVARIAQSVEQGIENPRVLGSIPSPGTTILKNPPTRRVFAFWDSGFVHCLLNLHNGTVNLTTFFSTASS